VQESASAERLCVAAGLVFERAVAADVRLEPGARSSRKGNNFVFISDLL
jgi:hypothetical protein